MLEEIGREIVVVEELKTDWDMMMKDDEVYEARTQGSKKTTNKIR